MTMLAIVAIVASAEFAAALVAVRLVVRYAPIVIESEKE